MIAGTIARLREPSDSRLTSAAASDGSLPALEVEETQQTIDGREVQAGTAADTVAEPAEDVFVTDRGDEGVSITSEPAERRVDVTTDWIAEPQDSGLLCAASVRGDGDFAFPFGLFGAQLDARPERLEVDVDDLKERWEADEALRETTMVGSESDGTTSIEYGDAARPAAGADLGLGFEVSVEFGIVEGVVWRSGYVALYDVDLPERFVQFVLGELWPHAYVPEDDEDEAQATLDEAAGDGGAGGGITAPEDPSVCDHCGNEPSMDGAEIEVVDGYALCPVHAQGYRDGRLTDADIAGGEDGGE